tara:strand:- start:208 stop:660 length:453 start_codon:yes stop_codon:yes gene_type:complete
MPETKRKYRPISQVAHADKSDKIFLDHIADNIQEYEGKHFDDLHHFLFNEEYFISGDHQAQQFIIKNDLNTYDITTFCQEKEKEEFGEINNTFDNAEKLVNHYAYWRGEELLNSFWIYISSFKLFGQKVTKELIKEVKKERKNIRGTMPF